MNGAVNRQGALLTVQDQGKIDRRDGSKQERKRKKEIMDH